MGDLEEPCGVIVPFMTHAPAAADSSSSLEAKTPLKPWFVYILRCSNNCLYTGITTDVRERLAVHNSGKGSAYVRAHRPAKLVAFSRTENRSSASKLEYFVKALTRPEKVSLAREWKAAQKKTASS